MVNDKDPSYEIPDVISPPGEYNEYLVMTSHDLHIYNVAPELSTFQIRKDDGSFDFIGSSWKNISDEGVSQAFDATISLYMEYVGIYGYNFATLGCTGFHAKNEHFFTAAHCVRDCLCKRRDNGYVFECGSKYCGPSYDVFKLETISVCAGNVYCASRRRTSYNAEVLEISADLDAAVITVDDATFYNNIPTIKMISLNDFDKKEIEVLVIGYPSVRVGDAILYPLKDKIVPSRDIQKFFRLDRGAFKGVGIGNITNYNQANFLATHDAPTWKRCFGGPSCLVGDEKKCFGIHVQANETENGFVSFDHPFFDKYHQQFKEDL